MDSFELNKILGAVLFTCLVVLGMSIVSEAVFHAPQPEQPGYAIEVPEEGTAVAAGEEEEETPLPVRLAEADPAEGEGGIRPCMACHTFEEGGAARVGPNLYNIVGNDKAHQEGFSYSSAMEERAAAGETWGYEELDGFLANPRGYLPGTTMSFAGVRDPQTRADILAYLASISPDAPAMPEAEAPAEGDEAAAEGEAAEGEGADTGDGEPAAEGEPPAEDGEATDDGEAAPAAGEPAPEAEEAPEPGAAEEQPAAEEDAPAEDEAPAEEEQTEQ